MTHALRNFAGGTLAFRQFTTIMSIGLIGTGTRQTLYPTTSPHHPCADPDIESLKKQSRAALGCSTAERHTFERLHRQASLEPIEATQVRVSPI